MEKQNYEECIQSCINGDEEACHTLYTEHVDDIYRFVMSKLQDKVRSEDICADVFFKVFEKLTDYDPQKGSFRTRLYRIAYTTLIDHTRKKSPIHCYDRLLDTASHHDQSLREQTNARVQRKEVQGFLATLSLDQREIFMMRLWDGLQYDEISYITGKSMDACKQGFHRTLKKLQEQCGHLTAFAILCSLIQTNI